MNAIPMITGAAVAAAIWTISTIDVARGQRRLDRRYHGAHYGWLIFDGLGFTALGALIGQLAGYFV